MDRYDPEIAPDAKDWLALEETEQQSLVERYHRKAKLSAPNPSAHASFHVIVENQLATREPSNVVATLERLIHEGLSRHESIHAIASVATTHIYHQAKNGAAPTLADYAADLNRLTVGAWHAEYGEKEEDELEDEKE